MAQVAHHDDTHVPTMSTSYGSPQRTVQITQQRPDFDWQPRREWANADHDTMQWQGEANTFQARGLGSTGKGILIGMLSAFGSAAFVALIVAIVYFFRYTSRGRIFLDRIGRPGEFDDEQQFLREEEEALSEMDELQRAEYMRAKGW
jgi:hypothetical protein